MMKTKNIKLNFVKKITKKILVTLVPLSSLLIGVSCQKFGNLVNFVGIGSNSVSPLVMGEDSFMTKNPVGNYIYQNTGSGDGYKSQMNKDGFTSDFGMTSSKKNPSTYAKEDKQKLIELEKLWKNKKLRTVTYAFDAIGIGVHLPDKMSLKNDAKTPIINLNQLANLYSKDKNIVQSVTWDSLVENENDQFKDEWNANAPIAIGIKGGENTSGKAEAFVKVVDKLLAKTAKNPTQRIVNNNQKFSFIDNFNDIYLENQKNVGSVAYYSLGQISNIKLSKIKIASIKTLSDDLTIPPNIEMVQNGEYRWSRPFNIIYSIENSKSVAFANYLISNLAQNLILRKNFVALNSQQVKIQLPTWIPDLDYTNDKNETIEGMNNKESLNYGL